MLGFGGVGPVGQSAIATTVNWLLTAVGAASVFAVRRISKRTISGMLGFAGGVMLAASYWSLLAPAIEITSQQGGIPWIPPLIGFGLGSATLLLADRILHQFRPRLAITSTKGTSHRSLLVATAITVHNLPEGLAVGVAFGAVASEGSGATLAAAVALSIGIGIQNVPEGMAISLPLRAEGTPRRRAFNYGQASGLVEIVGGVVGAASVVAASTLLPYALAFAAGAMILVTLKELIPESMATQEAYSAFGIIAGFALMMTLDVALG